MPRHDAQDRAHDPRNGGPGWWWSQHAARYGSMYELRQLLAAASLAPVSEVVIHVEDYPAFPWEEAPMSPEEEELAYLASLGAQGELF